MKKKINLLLLSSMTLAVLGCSNDTADESQLIESTQESTSKEPDNIEDYVLSLDSDVIFKDLTYEDILVKFQELNKGDFMGDVPSNGDTVEVAVEKLGKPNLAFGTSDAVLVTWTKPRDKVDLSLDFQEDENGEYRLMYGSLLNNQDSDLTSSDFAEIKDDGTFELQDLIDILGYPDSYTIHGTPEHESSMEDVTYKYNGDKIANFTLIDGGVTLMSEIEEESTSESANASKGSENSSGWSKEKCEENAEKHPAKAGSVLVTKGDYDFTGMPYYFSGTLEAVDIVSEFDGKTVWLVRNDEGYAIPVEMPDGEDAEIGSQVDIWGTLSGEGYTIESVDNVVGEVGYLIMHQYDLNGEQVI